MLGVKIYPLSFASASTASGIAAIVSEYYMTQETTLLISLAIGVLAGCIVYPIAVLIERRHLARKAAGAATPNIIDKASNTTEILPEDEDEEAVKQNPGHHAAVIRLILKAETVEVVDSLFDGYINSPSHHQAYETDVVVVHYLRKCQLLEDPQELTRWYIEENQEIQRRYGLTPQQFNETRGRAEAKYPELAETWRINKKSDK